MSIGAPCVNAQQEVHKDERAARRGARDPQCGPQADAPEEAEPRIRRVGSRNDEGQATDSKSLGRAIEQNEAAIWAHRVTRSQEVILSALSSLQRLYRAGCEQCGDIGCVLRFVGPFPNAHYLSQCARSMRNLPP